MDLIDYIESNNTPSLTKFSEVKQRIKNIMSIREPDMDVSDNSVVGDLVINRFAKIVALAEEAQDCIFSDIQLSNILNGNICDCTFAEAFIKSLGVENLLQVNTYGILRLTFNADAILSGNYTSYDSSDGETILLSLDAGTSIGFDNEYMFRFYMPKQGPINIYFPRKDFSPINGINDTPFGKFSKDKNNFFAGISEVVADDAASSSNMAIFKPSTFFVDLPIFGPSNASVAAGDEPKTDISSVLLNEVITNIQVLQNIEPLELPTSLIQLAKLTQKVFPSSNFTTKPGVISYVTKQFPFTNCVTPLTQNDDAGRKCYVSRTNSLIATLDIYAKKGIEDITVTQYVPRAYMNQVAFMAPIKKILDASYVYRNSDSSATLVENLSAANYTTVTLDTIAKSDDAFLDIMAYSFNNGRDPTPLQTLNSVSNKFAVLNVFDKGYNTLPINLTTDDQFKFNYVKITYTYDMASLFAGTLIPSTACDPFISTLSRNYINLDINQLVVNYLKQPNTFIDRQLALDNLYTLMNEIASPLVFNSAYIVNILLNSGAAGVNSIQAIGDIKLCNATSHLIATTQDSKIYAGDVCKNTAKITSLKDIKGTFKASAGERLGPTTMLVDSSNLAYSLEKDNISLIEQSTSIL